MPDLSKLKVPSLKKAAETTLEVFKEKEAAGHAPITPGQQPEPSALTATNILTSALEGEQENKYSCDCAAKNWTGVDVRCLLHSLSSL